MFKKTLKLGLPDWRWLLAAFAFVVAAGVATPLVAQAATVTVWDLGAQVTDLRIGPSDEVWTMTGGAPRKLDPATNDFTTYSHPLAGTGVLAVDGAGMVWSPDSFSTAEVTVAVISRLNPTTLQVTSWPTGDNSLATSIAVDTAGDVWFARATAAVWRLNPASNTITKWTLPISNVSIGRHPFDPSGRVWLRYSGGVAMLNPSTSYLTYWAIGGSLNPFAHTDGNAWFARQLSGVDRIARLDPTTNELTEWECRTGCDGLVEVRLDSTGNVWFTEDGAGDTSYIGRLDPAADPPAFSEWPLPGPHITGYAGQTLPRGLDFDSAGSLWVRAARLGGHGGVFYYWVATLTP